MKWFSPQAIFKEISKIRWPKKKDLATNSVQVVIFTAFFAAFFYLCQFLVSVCLKLIGVMN
ncbi:MAG: preprotein translocase subunit SecE [Erysipelotrichaceae bacterium]|nr:preprotein translocase subunit SecE [Erysipelotrichaceae bacterium]